MSTAQKPKIFCYADFNIENLIQRAERIRNKTCTCDESQKPEVGSLNFVIFLSFDDGVQWVFRAPTAHWGHLEFSESTESRLLASEVATLKYVREHTSIPVPEVFDYSSTSDNDIGVPYILMSKAAGHSLARYDWLALPDPPNVRWKPKEHMTEEQKEKIMYQLGCFAGELFNLRLPRIGSLLTGDKGYYVDECLSPGYVWQQRDEIEGVQRGPFHTESDYYVSLANVLRLHAEELRMGHHILQAPVPVQQEFLDYDFDTYRAATDWWNDYATLNGGPDSTSNRMQYCVASRFMQESIIPSLLDRNASTGYPLCHHDLSVDNIFVDEELNITCLIDWACASTVPPAQLLIPPGLPHPRDLTTDPSSANAFRLGFESINTDTKHVVKPMDWGVGQMIARFTRIVNQDALQDWIHLEHLHTFASNRTAAEDDDNDDAANSLPEKLAARAKEPDMQALALEFAEYEDPRSKIEEREHKFFDRAQGGATRWTCARKVALAASMNPRFVADARLWRWIMAAMEHIEMYDGPAMTAHLAERALEEKSVPAEETNEAKDQV